MHQAVRDYARTFLNEFEGTIPHMYLDIRGLVTVAIGNLIDPKSLALKLPFVSKTDGEAASPEQIAADWQAVKNAQALARRGHRAFESMTGLCLSEESISELFDARLEQFATELQKTTEFSTFEDWPADAQLALLGMAWAMGPAFAAGGRWPALRAACAEQDFTAAAASSAISNGNANRNAAHRKLFENAARALSLGAASDALYYPGDVPVPEATDDGARGLDDNDELRDAIVEAARGELAYDVHADVAGDPDESGEQTRQGYERLVEYFETAAPGIWSEDLIKYLRPKRPAWCGIFALWAMKTAGCELGTWRQSRGISSVQGIKQTSQPARGDVGYQDQPWQHHFIIAEVLPDGRLKTVEGNSGTGSTIVEKVRTPQGLSFYTVF